MKQRAERERKKKKKNRKEKTIVLSMHTKQLYCKKAHVLIKKKKCCDYIFVKSIFTGDEER